MGVNTIVRDVFCVAMLTLVLIILLLVDTYQMTGVIRDIPILITIGMMLSMMLKLILQLVEI
jgi:hypothetical protein